jgi:hypothetical protein
MNRSLRISPRIEYVNASITDVNVYMLTVVVGMLLCVGIDYVDISMHSRGCV